MLAAIGACAAEGRTASDSRSRAGPGDAALTAAAPMRAARAMHSATRLLDGRILIVGGGTPEEAVGLAEILDAGGRPLLVVPTRVARLGHTATLLPSGKVLIVGGGYGSAASARSAELFDPATNAFGETGGPSVARSDHAAVLLTDGSVLVIGGDVSGVGATPSASAEIYDPSTGAFRATGSMTSPRRPSGVVRLRDGQVLVTGGATTGKRVLATAELYDPRTGRFVRTGDMSTPREKQGAALLADGRVLIVGGSRGPADADRLRTTELYDPVRGRFAAGPAMRNARHKLAVVTVREGEVLVVGGGPDLAELYRADRNAFITVPGGAGVERLFPAAVALADGRVLISGGYTGGGARAESWLYGP